MVLQSATINRVEKEASGEVQPGTIFYTEMSEGWHADGSIVSWSPECGGTGNSFAPTRDRNETERSFPIDKSAAVYHDNVNSIFCTRAPAAFRAIDADAKGGEREQPESSLSSHEDDDCIVKRFVTFR